MSDDAPGRGLSATNRYIGERYGNLEYHVKVIAQERREAERKLEEVKDNYDGKEKFKKQRSVLNDFKKEVKYRLGKVQKQIDGVKDHLDDEAVELAEHVRDTSMDNFQNEDDEDYDTTFQTASERN